MSQLILRGFYKSLALDVVDMVRPENPNNLQIIGPIWLMHLWINATFESSLKHKVLPHSRVGIEGPRLAKLT